MKVKSESEVTQSCLTLSDPKTSVSLLIFCFDDLSIGVSGVFKSPAAAAKSLQSCPTLCDPTDGSPSGSPVPGILQARTLEWAAISFSNA